MGVYLVYFFADKMCTSSQVLFMPLLPKVGYENKVIFLEQAVKSVISLFSYDVSRFRIYFLPIFLKAAIMLRENF